VKRAAESKNRLRLNAFTGAPSNSSRVVAEQKKECLDASEKISVNAGILRLRAMFANANTALRSE
jgi:hypothetical protein